MEVGGSSTVSYPDIFTEEEQARTDLGGIPARLVERKPEPANAGLDALEGVQEDKEPVEYLKISEERLASIVKAPQGGKKKDKPQFPHTCTRCGKVWNMPIQLDPSRPMYCSECLPLIKEERTAKASVMKTALRGAPAPESGIELEEAAPASKSESKLRDTFALAEEAPPAKREPAGENRPRIVGAPKAFPPRQQGTVRITPASSKDEDGLLASLIKSKGKPIETNKDRLTQGRDATRRPAPHDSGPPRGKRRTRREENPALNLPMDLLGFLTCSSMIRRIIRRRRASRSSSLRRLPSTPFPPPARLRSRSRPRWEAIRWINDRHTGRSPGLWANHLCTHNQNLYG